jgi:hypothetical protein
MEQLVFRTRASSTARADCAEGMFVPGRGRSDPESPSADRGGRGRVIDVGGRTLMPDDEPTHAYASDVSGPRIGAGRAAC